MEPFLNAIIAKIGIGWFTAAVVLSGLLFGMGGIVTGSGIAYFVFKVVRTEFVGKIDLLWVEVKRIDGEVKDLKQLEKLIASGNYGKRKSDSK